MQRRHVSVFLAVAPLAVTRRAHAADPSNADAAAGIRVALERGASAAVSALGRPDGFLGNPQVRIPLPGYLEDAAKMLRMAGQQRRVDELVTAMNRAAEAAVPDAKSLLTPFPASEMTSHRVSRDVNDTKIDDEHLVQQCDTDIGVNLRLF